MQEVVCQIQKEANVLVYVKCMYIYTVSKHMMAKKVNMYIIPEGLLSVHVTQVICLVYITCTLYA